MIALTATADKLVRRDIVEKLGIPKAEVLISSFNRPNIKYSVEAKRNSYDRLLDFLAERKDKAALSIVLAAIRSNFAEDLASEGYSALPYHAGLDKACATAPGKIHQRRSEDRGRDDRLRHGHRQIERSVRRAHGSPEERRELPPGNGPSRPDGLPSDAFAFFSFADVSN